MYDPDDVCCASKDCIGDCLADVEECFCSCHENGSESHGDPCCFICVLCGKNIKLNRRSAHQIQCRVSSGC